MTYNQFNNHRTKKNILRLIIAILLILFVFMQASAQTKPDTARKQAPRPGWAFNPAQPFKVNITFTLPSQYISNWGYVATYPGGMQAIAVSPSLTGQQITAYGQCYQAVEDSIGNALIKQYNQFITTDKAKFKADSILKYAPKKSN